jgi:hypothetical protein
MSMKNFFLSFSKRDVGAKMMNSLVRTISICVNMCLEKCGVFRAFQARALYPVIPLASSGEGLSDWGPNSKFISGGGRQQAIMRMELGVRKRPGCVFSFLFVFLLVSCNSQQRYSGKFHPGGEKDFAHAWSREEKSLSKALELAVLMMHGRSKERLHLGSLGRKI